MKRKMLNLMLSLVMVFTLAAIVAPVGATPAAATDPVVPPVTPTYGGFSSYDLDDYDVAYVAQDRLGAPPIYKDGDDVTGDGSMEEPWRTIDYAISQLNFPDGKDNPDGVNEDDMIVVGPAEEWYGGASPNDENIVVDKPVTIVSLEGPGTLAEPVTGVDVEGQPVVPQAVIEITSDDVVIDGLFLTGAATGIYAHGDCDAQQEPECIEEVYIINCIIKIDEVSLGTGIAMCCVKYPVIDGNIIVVGVEGGELNILSVDSAWGIDMIDCFQSQITNNEIDVHGECIAVGIEMQNCPKSLVGVLPADEGSDEAPNAIEVLADGDVVGIGIKAEYCDLIDILYNHVGVEANGDIWAIAYGIKVKDSKRSDTNENLVFVDVEMAGGEIGGFIMGRGIALKCCNESNANGNSVTVIGDGDVSVTEAVQATLDEDIAEDLAEFAPVLEESLGVQSFNAAFGVGTVVGISVTGSSAVAVKDNCPVDVTLNLDTTAGDEALAVGAGGGCAIGISGLLSPGIDVCTNDISVYDWVLTQVTAEASEAEVALGVGLSTSMGVILFMSPGAVTGNDIEADADCDTYIESVGADAVALETGSALDRLDSVILNAILQQEDESLASEAIGVEISGDMTGIESIGADVSIAAGFGVLAIKSNGVAVIGNAPVSGTGDAIAYVRSLEEAVSDPALAGGGGLGLGIGSAIIDCEDATVASNRDVFGGGTADVDIGAQHGEDDDGPSAQYAGAAGGGAGIGVGILLCGIPDYGPGEAELVNEQWSWGHGPVVEDNTVSALGAADPINISAEDFIPSHEACATGVGLGVAMGIAAVWYPCIEIEGNIVTADGSAVVDIYSQAIHEFDPTSIGGAKGVGVGIVTVGCFKAQIEDNEAIGTGTASGEVGATELVIEDSNAFGGSLGIGVGILVIDSWRSLVSGNSVATGLGDAQCDVIATSYIPLEDAYAFALSVGIGKGIVVMCSPCTDVVRCNTAAGEGTARVCSTANADFDDEDSLGFAASIDILMKLDHAIGGFTEQDLDEQGFHNFFRFGKVNYNSIVDAVPLEENEGPVYVMDVGLLKIGKPCLDATLNWWNDPTGPSGMGPGIVKEYEPGKFAPELVFWCGHPVKFSPWLYVIHTDVLEEQIGKFGFYIPMCKGLNTFSTPIALEESVVPSRTWDNIVTNSDLTGKVKFIRAWNDLTQEWENVDGEDYIDPLYGYYIYMRQPGVNIILMVNSSGEHPYAMPIRHLLPGDDTEGWALIGPNPLFPEPCMRVNEALSSIEQTPAGLPGYTQAISPPVWCQPAWTFVPGMHNAPDMLSGRGYWVWMENPDTLVGFGFTPLPAGP